MPIMATTTIKNIGDRLEAEGLDDERDGMDRFAFNLKAFIVTRSDAGRNLKRGCRAINVRGPEIKKPPIFILKREVG
ncbi:hypothetical protein AYJ59_04750 [Thiomicrospira sp. S5]|nr:hypothetical protein AYJ59_04750 [Thiomicrospira sp. S5]